MATRQLSIAQTLTSATIVTTMAVLVAASVAFAAYDRTSFRAAAVRALRVQAEIITSNVTSSIVFDDRESATATVAALGAAPAIRRATIFGGDGERFASFQRPDAADADAEPSYDGRSASAAFEGNTLRLAHPIMLDDRYLGHLSIESDLSELDARRNAYLQMTAVVLTISLGATLLLARLTQETVSRPITALAALTRDVSARRDYGVRSDITSRARELSQLSANFNEMLGEIQSRDDSLRRAQEELEERVRQRTAELEVVNRELEAFSYSVSHDLRAPLRHITGFAELLIAHAGQTLDATGQRYLKTITKSSRQMAQLVDDLLAFSRMSRSPLSKRTTNLDAIVADAKAELANAPGAAGRIIEWRIGALPSVEGDPAMLRQVFLNLLSNAVKYTSTREQALIEIGTLEDGPQAVSIFVRDNGVGFDMEYADKLFGVFQRLHRADEFEGTGIGLANIKRIVTRHGGRVSAEAAPDRGATFYVTLPKEGPR